MIVTLIIIVAGDITAIITIGGITTIITTSPMIMKTMKAVGVHLSTLA